MLAKPASNPRYDHDVLNDALRISAENYLWDELKKNMDTQIKDIAAKAVANWAEIKFDLSPPMAYGDTNINIEFVEHIIKYEMKTNPISITTKG